MSINYIEKGAGLFDVIALNGHILYNLDGVWYSDDDEAVQAIIDAYVPNPVADNNAGAEIFAHPGKLLEVDNSRTDEYTANGSKAKPFKTIQAAIDSIPTGTNQDNRYTVHLNAGVYIENVTLAKPYVSLLGDGWVETCIKGDLIITASGLEDWRNSIVSMKIGGSALSGHNHVTVSVTAPTPTYDTTINFKSAYIRDWDYINTAFTATCADKDKISLNFFESYFGDSTVAITKCSVYNINTSWGPATTLYDGAYIWQVGGWQLGTITLQNGAYVVTQTCPQLDPAWCYLAWVVNTGCTLCLDDVVENTTYSITGAGTVTRLGKDHLKANIAGQVFTGAISATNLSGTNTGDQDISGKANLSGCTFTNLVQLPYPLLIPTAGFPPPLPGQITFNSDDNHFYGYNGTTWRPLDTIPALWEGLTHYWKLDNMVDTITSTVGTTTGTITYGPSYGKIGNGALGANNGSLANYIDTGVVGPIGNSQFTHAGWFYFPPEAQIIAGILSGTWGYIGAIGQKDGFPPMPPFTRAYIYGCITSPNQSFGSDAAPWHVALSTWHHLAMTFDGDIPRAYLNGSLIWTGTSAAHTISSGNLCIGNYMLGGPSYCFNGANLDEVCTWCRALTPTEITQVYAAGAGRQYPI
jgi:hypothetical protein